MISTRGVSRLVGLVAVAVAVSAPVLLAPNGSLNPYLTPAGRDALSHPIVVFLQVFGAIYASIGEMKLSAAIAIAVVLLVREVVSFDGGQFAQRFVAPDAVARARRTLGAHRNSLRDVIVRVQKNIPVITSSARGGETETS